MTVLISKPVVQFDQTVTMVTWRVTDQSQSLFLTCVEYNAFSFFFYLIKWKNHWDLNLFQLLQGVSSCRRKVFKLSPKSVLTLHESGYTDQNKKKLVPKKDGIHSFFVYLYI